MTTLLFDIGNSRIKLGALVEGAICNTDHLPLQQIAQLPGKLPVGESPTNIESAIACNVAGAEIASNIAGLIDSTYGIDTQFVKSTAVAGGVSNAYSQPERLGVDRWVALIGARATTDSACLIVDVGTAITLDVMDHNGLHLGGQILPGLNLMATALNRNTSDLPLVSATNWHDVRPDSPFAASTPDAISQGILSSVSGAIELGYRLLREDHPGATLLLTGGDADVIQPHLRMSTEIRPNLVLEGLAQLSQGNLEN